VRFFLGVIALHIFGIVSLTAPKLKWTTAPAFAS